MKSVVFILVFFILFYINEAKMFIGDCDYGFCEQGCREIRTDIMECYCYKKFILKSDGRRCEKVPDDNTYSGDGYREDNCDDEGGNCEENKNNGEEENELSGDDEIHSTTLLPSQIISTTTPTTSVFKPIINSDGFPTQVQSKEVLNSSPSLLIPISSNIAGFPSSIEKSNATVAFSPRSTMKSASLQDLKPSVTEIAAETFSSSTLYSIMQSSSVPKSINMIIQSSVNTSSFVQLSELAYLSSKTQATETSIAESQSIRLSESTDLPYKIQIAKTSIAASLSIQQSGLANSPTRVKITETLVNLPTSTVTFTPSLGTVTSREFYNQDTANRTFISNYLFTTNIPIFSNETKSMRMNVSLVSKGIKLTSSMSTKILKITDISQSDKKIPSSFDRILSATYKYYAENTISVPKSVTKQSLDVSSLIKPSVRSSLSDLKSNFSGPLLPSTQFNYRTEGRSIVFSTRSIATKITKVFVVEYVNSSKSLEVNSTLHERQSLNETKHTKYSKASEVFTQDLETTKMNLSISSKFLNQTTRLVHILPASTIRSTSSTSFTVIYQNKTVNREEVQPTERIIPTITLRIHEKNQTKQKNSNYLTKSSRSTDLKLSQTPAIGDQTSNKIEISSTLTRNIKGLDSVTPTIGKFIETKYIKPAPTKSISHETRLESEISKRRNHTINENTGSCGNSFVVPKNLIFLIILWLFGVVV